MLKDMGVFRDPLVSSIQGDFSPWLYEQITEELNKQEDIRYELNCIYQYIYIYIKKNSWIPYHSRTSRHTVRLQMMKIKDRCLYWMIDLRWYRRRNYRNREEKRRGND